MTDNFDKAYNIASDWAGTFGFKINYSNDRFEVLGNYTTLIFDDRFSDVLIKTNENLPDYFSEDTAEEIAEMRAIRDSVKPLLKEINNEKGLFYLKTL
jgi:hypothetical protein